MERLALVLGAALLLAACGSSAPGVTPATPPVTAPPTPAPNPTSEPSAIDGIWRLEVEEQVLLDAGTSTDDARVNAGAWTWTFHDDAFDFVEPLGRTCEGAFTLEGTDLTATESTTGCDGVWHLTATRSGSQLTLEPAASDDFYAAFFHNPLVRVGDAT